MSGFQKTVNPQQAPGVEGDFASNNPRATYDAGEAALVAGALGVTIGKFAWVAPDGRTVNNFANGATQPDGFVHREMQGLITNYLGESSMVIPPGFPVTLHTAGDFFAKNIGANATTKNGTVYADYSDGSIRTTIPTGIAATGSIGATFTATGTGTALVVTAVTGLISIGDTIAGTGVPAGTTIIAQPSGTTGGAGTYTTSVATTAAAATVTAFGSVLNVTAVSSGVLAVGDAVSGTGVPANATLASQVSGATGGVGVYTLNTPATAYAASTALTGVDGIATTAWKFKTVVAVGELAKISTWGN